MKGLCASTFFVALIVMLSFFLDNAAMAELNCNAGIEFHPNGGIKSCNLNGNHELYTAQGQRLVCSNGYVLVQYPGGELRSCTILMPLAVGSIQCEPLSHIELAVDGTILKCE